MEEAAAEAGSVEGMYWLGVPHREGWGVAQDFAAARRFALKAADRGHAGAMRVLGDIYLNGLGVEPNGERAADWYRQAHAGGDVGALTALGIALRDGKGMAADRDKALTLLSQAADAGDTDAMVALSELVVTLEGPDADAEAVAWLERAAAGGSAEELYQLAARMEIGEGVPADIAKGECPLSPSGHGRQCCRHVPHGGRLPQRAGVEENPREARRWLLSAADEGHGASLYLLWLLEYHGRFGAPDYERAAHYLVAAARAGHKQSHDDPTSARLSQDKKPLRIAIQRRLSQLGHYTGALDGNFGPATRAAIEALLSQ